MELETENPITKYSKALGIESIMSLSLVTDIGCDTLYHLAKGRRLPSDEVCKKLAVTFGIESSDLRHEFESYRQELRTEVLNEMGINS